METCVCLTYSCFHRPLSRRQNELAPEQVCRNNLQYQPRIQMDARLGFIGKDAVWQRPLPRDSSELALGFQSRRSSSETCRLRR